MKKSNSYLNKYPQKKYPTIGVCGLDCGLCPRYYTIGESRCPGCCGPDFFIKHPSCSFITCCVKKKNYETCGECPDFPCTKFKSAEDYKQIKESSSYPSNKKILPNLYFIKEQGIGKFIVQQNNRIQLLNKMLNEFNDGRSKSYFCRTAIFYDLPVLENSIKKAMGIIKSQKIKRTDMKTKASIIKSILEKISFEK